MRKEAETGIEATRHIEQGERKGGRKTKREGGRQRGRETNWYDRGRE